MDQAHLERLRIKSEAKRRPQGTAWGIFIVILLITGGALYMAWPRISDRVRVMSSQSSNMMPKSSTSPATNAPAMKPLPTGTPDSKVPALTVNGYIITHERIAISPRFLGIVRWIGVSKGDAVTNGQVLVRLDDSEQKARVAEAEGRLLNAKTALAKAELDYDRIRKLIIDKIESRQNEDDARLRVESTRATILEAEAQLALMKTYLEWTVIRSPINGVVLEKLARAGELVTPQSFGGSQGPSTALVAVADPNDLQVEVDLDEKHLAKVFLKQECQVTPEAYPDKQYSAFVTEISPEANRPKGTLQIKVQIRNPDRHLTPELSAKVDFFPSPSPK